MPSFCTYFISDLHLQADRPEITRAFREFMQTRAHFADALYILGDLFNSWIGDDDDSGFHQSIYNEFNYLTQQGTPVYFIHGNRDFLIGERFAKQTGVTLLADPSVITLYGQRYLLSHGDILCTQDVSYQRFRCIIRSRPLIWLANHIPLTWRQRTAEKMRRKSQQHTQTKAHEIMDVHQPAVIKLLKQHQVTHLIHGHTHRPNTHEFNMDGIPHTRTVLGCWDDGITYLKIEAAGNFTLSTQT